jgi:dihydropteroate synthase
MSAIAFQPTWGTRTYVMGILNVSPDSFSGDGIVGSERALEMTLGMVEDGADIIDIGGESTRPGSDPVSLEEELGRVLPAVELLVERLGVPVSVDTYKAEVAQAALERGVTILNDIWGLKKEPRLADMAAQYNAHLVLMSNQRDVSPRHDVEFPDIVDVVLRDLTRATSLAMARGVPKDHIIIDPGIGFGKTQPQNVELLRRLGELRALGFPMLVGTSRKSVLGHILNLPADERLEATAATVALAVSLGADVVRVHDVREMSRVCKVADAIVRG